MAEAHQDGVAAYRSYDEPHEVDDAKWKRLAEIMSHTLEFVDNSNPEDIASTLPSPEADEITLFRSDPAKTASVDQSDTATLTAKSVISCTVDSDSDAEDISKFASLAVDFKLVEGTFVPTYAISSMQTPTASAPLSSNDKPSKKKRKAKLKDDLDARTTKKRKTQQSEKTIDR